MVNIDDLKEMVAAGVPLREIFRRVASETLCEVLAIEASEFLGSCQNTILEDGSPRYILNGHTVRKFVTPCGVLDVRQPRLRDKAGGEKKMTRDSIFLPLPLPAFIRRSIEDIIPYLYLKGLSTEGIHGAFAQLFGEDARGFSPATVCRLIDAWEAGYAEWNKRTIEDRCPYIWVDGIFLNVRGIEENQCVLAAVGVNEDGRKDLLGLSEGFAESVESWKGLLLKMKSQGLQAPAVVIGDGALGAWAGLREVFPNSRRQNCWFHAIKAITSHLPKKGSALAVPYLREIYLSGTLNEAKTAAKVFEGVFEKKYFKATESLARNLDSLLTFFGYPDGRWSALRTTNTLESMFSSVRVRTRQTRGMTSGRKIGAMVFKLCQAVSNSFRRFRHHEDLRSVIKGRKYKDGKAVSDKVAMKK